jgi:hypothetical protein
VIEPTGQRKVKTGRSEVNGSDIAIVGNADVFGIVEEVVANIAVIVAERAARSQRVLPKKIVEAGDAVDREGAAVEDDLSTINRSTLGGSKWSAAGSGCEGIRYVGFN